MQCEREECDDLDGLEYGDVVHRPEDGRAKLLAASLAAKAAGAASASASSSSTSKPTRPRPPKSSQEWSSSQSSQSKPKPQLLVQVESSQARNSRLLASLQQSLGIGAATGATVTTSQETPESSQHAPAPPPPPPPPGSDTDTIAPTQVIAGPHGETDRPRVSILSLLSNGSPHANFPPPQAPSGPAPVSSSPTTMPAPAPNSQPKPSSQSSQSRLRTPSPSPSPPDPISFAHSLQPLHQGPRYTSGRKRAPTKPTQITGTEHKERPATQLDDDFDMPADLVAASQKSTTNALSGARSKERDRGEQLWNKSLPRRPSSPSPSQSQSQSNSSQRHPSTTGPYSSKRKRDFEQEFNEFEHEMTWKRAPVTLSQSGGSGKRSKSRTAAPARKETNLTELSAKYRAQQLASLQQKQREQEQRTQEQIQILKARSLSAVLSDVVKQEDQQKNKEVVADAIDAFPDEKKTKSKAPPPTPTLRLSSPPSSSPVSSTLITSPSQTKRTLSMTPSTPVRTTRAFLQDINMEDSRPRTPTSRTPITQAQPPPQKPITPTRGRSDWLKNLDHDTTIATDALPSTPTRSAEKARRKNARNGTGTLSHRLTQLVRDYKSKSQMEKFRVTSNTNAVGMGIILPDMPLEVQQPTRRVLSMSSPGPQLDLSATSTSAPKPAGPLTVRILSGHRHAHIYLAMCVLCSPPPPSPSQCDMTRITLPVEYSKYNIPATMLCQVAFPVTVADSLALIPDLYIRIHQPFRLLYSAWEQQGSVLPVRTILSCEVCTLVPTPTGQQLERDELDMVQMKLDLARDMGVNEPSTTEEISSHMKHALDEIQLSRAMDKQQIQSIMSSPDQPINDNDDIVLHPPITPISLCNIRTWTDLTHSVIIGVIQRILLRDTMIHDQYHHRPGVTCLYLSDAPGICIEIEIPQKLLSKWKIVLESEGKCIQMMNLYVVKKGRIPSRSSGLASFLSSLSCDTHSLLTLRVTDATTYQIQPDTEALVSLKRPLQIDPLRSVLAGKIQHRTTLLCRIAYTYHAQDLTTTIYVCDDSLQPAQEPIRDDMPLAVQALTTASVIFRFPWHLSTLRSSFHTDNIMLLRDVLVTVEMGGDDMKQLMDVKLEADFYTEIMGYRFATHTKSRYHRIQLVTAEDPFSSFTTSIMHGSTAPHSPPPSTLLIPVIETRVRIISQHATPAPIESLLEASLTCPQLVYRHGLLHFNGIVMDIIRSVKDEPYCPKCQIALSSAIMATKTELTYCHQCRNSAFTPQHHKSILLSMKIHYGTQPIWLLLDGMFADQHIPIIPKGSRLNLQQKLISTRITTNCVFTPIPTGVTGRAGETHCLHVINLSPDTRKLVIDDTTEGSIAEP